MNQILVTEKIYVTPELKRKKKIYKYLFILSILTIIVMFSVYLYTEYDRNRQENISGDILSFLTTEEDDTKVSSFENALIVKITQDVDETQWEEIDTTEQLSLATATSTYIASNGESYDTIGIIRIPSIGVDYPIFSRCTDEWLRVAPCKFHGGNPNEIGNLCIVGHNYRNDKFFSKVPTLQIGDIVEIQDLSQRTIQYEVYDIHTVIPEDVDDTTQKTNNKKEVTLVTCTNDSKQRVIVKCTEKK